MITSEQVLKGSPFQTNNNYNLNNTTSELLKFQLQEEHKNKTQEIGMNEDVAHHNNPQVLSGDVFNSSFNNHLQSKLDDGEITIEEIPSLISTPSSETDDIDNSDALINHQNNTGLNYLNLKVLIENSIFEISKINKDQIYSLDSLRGLKNLLEEKKDLKNYYLSKLSISKQFISKVIDENLDSSVLIKIVKSNDSLSSKILELNEEIDDLTSRLNNHNLSCLLLGYIDDIRLSGNSVNSSLLNHNNDSKQLFDKLIGYLVSVSVGRNINLPPPLNDNNDSIENKFDWVKQCIDTLISADSSSAASTVPNSSEINQNFTNLMDNSSTNMTIPSTSNNTPLRAGKADNSILNESSIYSMSPHKGINGDDNIKVLNEYRTALNDLRFSHQYLIKEFEYSRENSLKIVQDYRKKNNSLEKELSRLRGSTDNNSHDSKDKEIAKLRRELNHFKIDNLGATHKDSNLAQNGDQVADETSSDRPSSIGMSNGILRKEFKKIISDMQDQYEMELSQERLLRKKYQDDLNMSKNQLPTK